MYCTEKTAVESCSWVDGGRGKAGTMTRARNRWVASKSRNNAASAFFSAVNLLLKVLRFEHWDVKLVSCSGGACKLGMPLDGRSALLYINSEELL